MYYIDPMSQAVRQVFALMNISCSARVIDTGTRYYSVIDWLETTTTFPCSIWKWHSAASVSCSIHSHTLGLQHKHQKGFCSCSRSMIIPDSDAKHSLHYRFTKAQGIISVANSIYQMSFLPNTRNNQEEVLSTVFFI